jgi:hypothetical protein
MLAAGSCHAAAPLYFDLAGLILYGALYLLGLLVLLVAIFVSKKKAVWTLILVAYVVGPFAYDHVSTYAQRARDVRFFEEASLGEIKNVEAFAAYCKDRQRVVNRRVSPGADASLVFRHERAFTGSSRAFNADPIHAYMLRNQAICQKTGLGYLEGIYDGQYVAEKRGYEREVRLYRMCRAEKWSTVAQSQSRYELVLGESSEKKPTPWGSEAGRWMSKSSVRVIDKQTGAILAEDTMYFLRYDTGKGGCPNGVEQLASLIADVFPKE